MRCNGRVVLNIKKLTLSKTSLMNAAERRKKLHTYIADLNDKEINAMLTLLECESAYETKKEFTQKEKEEIRQREANRVSGKSKTYSLTEAKKNFRLKKKA